MSQRKLSKQGNGLSSRHDNFNNDTKGCHHLSKKRLLKEQIKKECDHRLMGYTQKQKPSMMSFN